MADPRDLAEQWLAGRLRSALPANWTPAQASRLARDVLDQPGVEVEESYRFVDGNWAIVIRIPKEAL